MPPDEKLDRILDSLHQVNLHLESLRVSLAAVVELTADHEHRLRTVERWRHNLTPLLTIATFTLGAVLTELLSRLI